MNENKKQATFVRYNGLGTIMGGLVGIASIAWIFSIINALFGNAFTGENDVFNMIMMTSSGAPVLLFIGLFYSWSSTGSLILSDLVLAKDLKYLGLESGEGGKRQYFKNKSLGKPNKPILRWLAYSQTWDGKSKQFKFDTDSGFLTLRMFGVRRHAAEKVTSFLKTEKRMIKALKKNKTYSKKVFQSGLPLASYLLLCDKYEDSEARALVFKNLNLNANHAYLLNQISTSSEDIENFLELPVSWLMEATDIKLKGLDKNTHVF